MKCLHQNKYENFFSSFVFLFVFLSYSISGIIESFVFSLSLYVLHAVRYCHNDILLYSCSHNETYRFLSKRDKFPFILSLDKCNAVENSSCTLFFFYFSMNKLKLAFILGFNSIDMNKYHLCVIKIVQHLINKMININQAAIS